jgi:SprT protein
MPKQAYPLSYLNNYMPAPAIPAVLHLLNLYVVELTITKERKTVLGDYRHALSNKTHRISINGNLNKYSFLITLIHELAHLITFVQFGHRVMAHGKEWKQCYKTLLKDFLTPAIFPEDICLVLSSSLNNLPASSCADENLMRVLRRYDAPTLQHVLVEEMADGALFAIENGNVFKKGNRLRKRFQCTEINSGKLYLFSGVYEVKPVL